PGAGAGRAAADPPPRQRRARGAAGALPPPRWGRGRAPPRVMVHRRRVPGPTPARRCVVSDRPGSPAGPRRAHRGLVLPPVPRGPRAATPLLPRPDPRQLAPPTPPTAVPLRRRVRDL